MLKKKATGFKPKARPRPNTTSTPSSSAKPSVERQTETPAPPSQPNTIPAEITQPNETPETFGAATQFLPIAGPSTVRSPAAVEERQIIQPSAAVPTSQEINSESTPAPVVSENTLRSATRTPVTNHTTVSATLLELPTPRNTESLSRATSVRTASPDHSAVTERTSLLSSTVSVANAAQTASSSSGAATESTSQRAIDVEAVKRSQRASIVQARVNRTTRRPSSSSQDGESSQSRSAKRRKVAQTSQDDILPTIEDEDETPEPDTSAPKKRSRKPRDPNAPKRKKRASTPQNAEEQVVDKATTTMADLTKDLRIGRNFSMREKILERESERKEKARLAKEKEAAEDSDATDFEGDSGENRDNTETMDDGTPALPEVPVAAPVAAAPVPAANSGPQLRLVNGVIVLDESSLQVDRHRLALEAGEEMAVVEEDDFTRIVTSGTYQKRERNTRWGHFETEKFYEGLRMFGTDFEMIAKMFGKKRSRRQVKLKYNKEEIENPDRIHRCITGRDKKAMDLNKLKNSSKMEDTDDIKAEIAALEKAYEDEENRQAEALAEVDRRKKATIVAGGAPGGGGGGAESSKENDSTSQKGGGIGAAQKPKKKPQTKKSKRAMVQHLGGEDFEIIGSI